MTGDTTVCLLARWRGGDESAARELVHRYADQLITLARGRLSAKIGKRVDAEDVVQSAYRSFFCAARNGRFELERGGDLWGLLVTLTLRKLYHQVRWNRAAKRTVSRERSLDDEHILDKIGEEVLARDPSPAEAIALADELQHLMRDLDPLERRMLELRLQGHSLEEIATATQRSERTVTRVLTEVRHTLQLKQTEHFLD